MGNKDSKPKANAPPSPARTTSANCQSQLDQIKNAEGGVIELIPLLLQYRYSPADTEFVIRSLIVRLDKHENEKESFTNKEGYSELVKSITAHLEDSGVTEWGVRCIIVAMSSGNSNDGESNNVYSTSFTGFKGYV